MDKKSIKKPLLTKQIKALKAIAAEVTTQDRKDCVEATGFSKVSVNQYLRGEAYSTETANIIIEFFTKRLQERRKAFVEKIASTIE